MKKLILVGAKKGWDKDTPKEELAEIYVKDGKLVVESKNPKIKEVLEKEIGHLAYEGGFYLRKGEEKRNKDGELVEHSTYAVPQKPGDEMFLEALKDRFPFWLNKVFDGYEVIITLSRIVEE